MGINTGNNIIKGINIGSNFISRAFLGSAKIYDQLDYPTLDLNFAATKTLDSRITFTRTSSGSYFDSNGVIQIATTNTPRFDHHPVTKESLGLLIEEQRTNLLLNSATLSTQSVAVTNVAHTLSFYGTGTIFLSGAHSTTVNGTGAFPIRTTLTFTPTTGTLTLTVSGTIQYAQLGVGNFATSWIPTTSASATRAADSALVVGTNFSSWFIQDNGSFYVEFSIPSGQNSFASGTSHVFGINNTGTSGFDGYGLTISRANASPIFRGRFNSTVASVSAGSATTENVIHKAAATISDINKLSVNGAINSGINTVLGITQNQLLLGNGDTGGISPYQLSGHIKRFCYYSRRFPDSELQLLTT